MREKNLNGRMIAHPDVLHLEAIIENNKRECVAIDKELGKRYRSQSSVGLFADVRDKKKFVPPTLHDLAADNPLLRDMLRQFSKST